MHHRTRKIAFSPANTGHPDPADRKTVLPFGIRRILCCEAFAYGQSRCEMLLRTRQVAQSPLHIAKFVVAVAQIELPL